MVLYFVRDISSAFPHRFVVFGDHFGEIERLNELKMESLTFVNWIFISSLAGKLDFSSGFALWVICERGEIFSFNGLRIGQLIILMKKKAFSFHPYVIVGCSM